MSLKKELDELDALHRHVVRAKILDAGRALTLVHNINCLVPASSSAAYADFLNADSDLTEVLLAYEKNSDAGCSNVAAAIATLRGMVIAVVGSES